MIHLRDLPQPFWEVESLFEGGVEGGGGFPSGTLFGSAFGPSREKKKEEIICAGPGEKPGNCKLAAGLLCILPRDVRTLTVCQLMGFPN